MGKREIDTRFKRDIYELITLKNLSLHGWQDPSKEFSLGMKGRRYKSLQVSTCLEEFAPRKNKRTGFRYVCRKKKKAVLSLFRFFPMKKKSRRIRKNFESLAASRRLEGILFFQPQRDSYGVFVTKKGMLHPREITLEISLKGTGGTFSSLSPIYVFTKEIPTERRLL